MSAESRANRCPDITQEKQILLRIEALLAQATGSRTVTIGRKRAQEVAVAASLAVF